MSLTNTITINITRPDFPENDGSYQLDVHCNDGTWNVKRSYEEFTSLHKSLFDGCKGLPALPSEMNEESLNKYLNNLLLYFKQEIWNTPTLLKFIDNSPTISAMDQIQLARLTKMILKLQQEAVVYQVTIRELKSKQGELLSVIETLQNVNSSRAAEDRLRTTSDNSVTSKELVERASLVSGVTDKSYSNTPVLEIEEVPLSVNNKTQGVEKKKVLVVSEEPATPQEGDREGNDTVIGAWARSGSQEENEAGRGGGSAQDNDSDNSTLSSQQNEEEDEDDGAADGLLPLSVGDDEGAQGNNKNMLRFRQPSPNTNSTSGNQGILPFPSPVKEPSAAILSSKHLAPEIYPTEKCLEIYTSSVDSIVDTLSQHETQLQYRGSVISFIKKQARSALGVSSFDITLNDLHCALPDDILRVSVVINKVDAVHWYKPLLDKLNLAAERSASVNGGGGPLSVLTHQHLLSQLNSPFDDAGSVGSSSSSSAPGAFPAVELPHSVYNVQLTTSKQSYKISCLVDNMPVEIIANNRSEMIFLAFFEELDMLVGQNHLFKRSVLLIRAWWVYETNNYIGMTIKHYIPDNSLCIMIAAVFNLYHAVITSPLHALSVFLSEYSTFNGTTHAITLQGIVPFVDGTNMPEVITPQEQQAAENDYLVSTLVIEKYYKVLNATPTVAENNGNHNKSAAAAAAQAARAAEEANSYYGNSRITAFERAEYSVVNPFDFTNMMISNSENSKLSSNSIARIQKVFTIGAMNLSVILKQNFATFNAVNNNNNTKEGSGDSVVAVVDGVDSEPTAPTATAATSTEYEQLTSFFPAALSRLANDWRPDAVNNSIISASELSSRNQSPNESTENRDAFNSSNNNKSNNNNSKNSRLKCLLSGNLPILWQNILYCNLILESVLTESALLALSCEILKDKGPLPVGEVGKMLSEITTFPHFTTRLKEKFGGLKKFLENFPHIIYISLDHPFNPNVLLRSTVTVEQLDLIDQGLLPIQSVIKARKAALAAASAAQVQSKKSHSPATHKSTASMGDGDMSLPTGSLSASAPTYRPGMMLPGGMGQNRPSPQLTKYSTTIDSLYGSTRVPGMSSLPQTVRAEYVQALPQMGAQQPVKMSKGYATAIKGGMQMGGGGGGNGNNMHHHQHVKRPAGHVFMSQRQLELQMQQQQQQQQQMMQSGLPPRGGGGLHSASPYGGGGYDDPPPSMYRQTQQQVRRGVDSQSLGYNNNTFNAPMRAQAPPTNSNHLIQQRLLHHRQQQQQQQQQMNNFNSGGMGGGGYEEEEDFQDFDHNYEYEYGGEYEQPAGRNSYGDALMSLSDDEYEYSAQQPQSHPQSHSQSSTPPQSVAYGRAPGSQQSTGTGVSSLLDGGSGSSHLGNLHLRGGGGGGSASYQQHQSTSGGLLSSLRENTIELGGLFGRNSGGIQQQQPQSHHHHHQQRSSLSYFDCEDGADGFGVGGDDDDDGSDFLSQLQQGPPPGLY